MTVRDTTLAPDEIHARTDGPVHTWFGLTYSNYLVLPRALMQSMPVDWQERIVGCLEELDAAFDHVERAPGYEVHACRWLAPVDMDDRAMLLAGVTCDDAGESDRPAYYDRDGNELDPEIGRVPVRCAEPVPHYNRGRTFIEPGAAS